MTSTFGSLVVNRFSKHVVADIQYVYQDISKKWFMFGDKYYFFIFIVCYL